MILTNLSNRGEVSTIDIRKLQSRTNLSHTHKLKEITIDVKLYLQVNTSFLYMYNKKHTHFQSLVYWGDKGGFLERMLLSSIHPHTCMSIFDV